MPPFFFAWSLENDRVGSPRIDDLPWTLTRIPLNLAACGRASFLSLVLHASPVARGRLRARLPRKLRATPQKTRGVTTLAGRKTAR